ncbi:MAG: hypothetical protein HC873_07855 [Leptolyngbyaceae cyanobacterium SL_1_1]|nr:hypothetical protein [Leptolyngbyaceae cyanobacterium RM1_1_2]NJO09577.1 hypothetical protein [Leptolyngbyaceae cyanobacterium SL_1_1]
MSTNRRQPLWLALDRVAISFMAALAVAIVLLLLIGDRAAARVRSFSWAERQVSAEDVAFLLTFSRPMDHTSVEANLKITPPLSGKFSWAGRRMAYTLDVPIPYGESFKIALSKASDRFIQTAKPAQFLPFQEQFQSRDRAFIYLGVAGEEQGRLVLFNLTQQARQILTPSNLVVIDFEPYPLGDRILFSATDLQSYQQGLLNQKIYTVTTGLMPYAPEHLGASSQPFWQRLLPTSAVAVPEAGAIETILDSDTYQNLKFDLSPNGQLVVVQRVNRQDPADFGPWIIRPDQEPQPLETEPGGDFLIAPDNQTLVMLQGEGTAVIPLPEADSSQQTVKPLEFLAEYGRVLDIASDGSAAALVNFNQNNPDQRYTESLFLVTNEGEEKELLSASGEIITAQFDPANRILYCLATELIEDQEYVEQPILTSVNIETEEIRDLLVLPPQRNISLSLAPDGLAVLFDQVVSVNESTSTDLRASDGSAISTSRIWLLPLFKTPADRIEGMPAQAIQPQELPFAGIRPVWLP